MRLLTLFLFLFSFCIAGFAKNNEADSKNVYTEDKLAVMVTKDHPQFSIKLKSNPTTGYSWFLNRYNANMLVPVKHSFEYAADRKLVGAPGFEVWTFQVKEKAFVVPMQTAIRFTYARPWESSQDDKHLKFTVSVMQK